MSDDCQPCHLLEEDQIRAASSILVRFYTEGKSTYNCFLEFWVGFEGVSPALEIADKAVPLQVQQRTFGAFCRNKRSTSLTTRQLHNILGGGCYFIFQLFVQLFTFISEL